MPFEQGSLSFRMYFMPRTLPSDAVQRFADYAAPPLSSSSEGVVRGWVTGRHLMDNHIDEDSAYYGGFLRLTLLTAERKIPTSLLKAECQMEELALAATKESGFISRKERSDIKRTITERLQPNMPPQLSGLPFVYHEPQQIIFANALSVTQMDLLTSYFTQTLGFAATPALPDTVAEQRKHIDVRDWQPASFSPQVDDMEMDITPGQDFLTWLWFAAESNNGMFTLPESGSVGLLIQGPLTFVHEGHGAHETVLKKGEPTISAEAKTCMLAGKKLQVAKLILTQGDDIWETTVNADQFTFRSMKLPEIEATDTISKFQERMQLLERFQVIFFELYDQFLDLRKSGSWGATKKEVRDWVEKRKVRR